MMNISDCAKKLPNAATTRDMVLEVEVGGKPGVKVAFERIKYLGKSGVSEARWSYKGRVLV